MSVFIGNSDNNSKLIHITANEHSEYSMKNYIMYDSIFHSRLSTASIFMNETLFHGTVNDILSQTISDDYYFNNIKIELSDYILDLMKRYAYNIRIKVNSFIDDDDINNIYNRLFNSDDEKNVSIIKLKQAIDLYKTSRDKNNDNYINFLKNTTFIDYQNSSKTDSIYEEHISSNSIITSTEYGKMNMSSFSFCFTSGGSISSSSTRTSEEKYLHIATLYESYIPINILFFAINKLIENVTIDVSIEFYAIKTEKDETKISYIDYSEDSEIKISPDEISFSKEINGLNVKTNLIDVNFLNYITNYLYIENSYVDEIYNGLDYLTLQNVLVKNDLYSNYFLYFQYGNTLFPYIHKYPSASRKKLVSNTMNVYSRWNVESAGGLYFVEIINSFNIDKSNIKYELDLYNNAIKVNYNGTFLNIVNGQVNNNKLIGDVVDCIEINIPSGGISLPDYSSYDSDNDYYSWSYSNVKLLTYDNIYINNTILNSNNFIIYYSIFDSSGNRIVASMSAVKDGIITKLNYIINDLYLFKMIKQMLKIKINKESEAYKYSLDLYCDFYASVHGESDQSNVFNNMAGYKINILLM